MKKSIAFSFVLIAFSVAGAQAQATRTWVSGVGDDVNPCSRTAPCKTFAGAISKTAIGGEISALDPGGFGAVTITKGITLNGDGTLAGVLNAGTNGITINAALTDVVTIRNVSINGAGSGLSGIRVLGAKAVHVENCEIYGNSGPGITVVNSVGTVSLLIRDSVIRNNTGDGIITAPTGSGGVGVILENVRADQNGLSGFKLGFSTSAVVSRSEFSANGNGITLSNATSLLDLESSTVARNNIGILNGLSGGAPLTRLSRCMIADNGTGISLAGGLVVGYSNNVIVDNGGGNTVSSSVAQQ